VQQIIGVGKTHLVGVVGCGAEPVHPIVVSRLLVRDDGARFRPTDVPVAFVGGQENAFAFPVQQVVGCGKAELRVFFVVAGVGHVIGAFDVHDAGIFYASAVLVIGFGRKDRVGMAREANAISALCIS
jgi:hypothetical protein